MGTASKKLLNVGSGGCSSIGPEYKEYEHVLLDIDASVKPHIIWDARELAKLPPDEYDLVYSSHNIEHFYFHEVPVVLSGMHHVLKPGGAIHLRCPDIVGTFKTMLENGRELTDTLYRTKQGFEVTALDVIYGWSMVIEQSGQPFYAHKTGFSVKTLHRALSQAGFVNIELYRSDIELKAIAYKKEKI